MGSVNLIVVSAPANEVLFGTGTSVGSSSHFTYNPAAPATSVFNVDFDNPSTRAYGEIYINIDAPGTAIATYALDDFYAINVAYASNYDQSIDLKYYGEWEPSNGGTLRWVITAQGASIGTVANVRLIELSDLGGLGITNPYYLYGDSRGVIRIREDATHDSAGQAVLAGYNQVFIKYTPGAANYERWTVYWDNNVVHFGTEEGGTGVKRPLKLISDGLEFESNPTFPSDVAGRILVGTGSGLGSSDLLRFEDGTGMWAGYSLLNIGPATNTSTALCGFEVQSDVSTGDPTLYITNDLGGIFFVTNAAGANVNLGANLGALILNSTDIQFVDGIVKSDKGFKTAIYHVADLGAADGASEGTWKGVDDALSPVVGATVVGGGSVHRPVYSNGSNWIVM